VVVSAVFAFSLAKRLGVMVGALPELILDRLRTLNVEDERAGGDGATRLEEDDHGSGELRADSKTSDTEEEGVW